MPRILGFDYGTKPSLMVVGDLGFPEFLHRSFVALGYSLIPEYGLLVNPPLLVMIFDDEATARECFDHFRGWCENDPTGDAIGMAFVEYDSGDYGFCTFQEPDRLKQRLVSEPEASEFQPLVSVASHLKLFPVRSPHYNWFKSTVPGHPFVLVPGTTDGKLFPDLAVKKDHVDFYTEHNIPSHSTVKIFAQPDRKSEPLQPMPAPGQFALSAEEIGTRRQAQLSRFFPVTIEQLAFSEQFRAVSKELAQKGYKPWQIVQAACNVTLKYRIPKLFRATRSSDGKSSHDRGALLDYLLYNMEDPSASELPSSVFSVRTLRNQIHADMRTLLGYVGFDHAADLKLTLPSLQKELDARDLLDGPDVQ